MVQIRTKSRELNINWMRRSLYTQSAAMAERFDGRRCELCSGEFATGDLVSVVNTVELGNVLVHEYCLVEQVGGE